MSFINAEAYFQFVVVTSSSWYFLVQGGIRLFSRTSIRPRPLELSSFSFSSLSCNEEQDIWDPLDAQEKYEGFLCRARFCQGFRNSYAHGCFEVAADPRRAVHHQRLTLRDLQSSNDAPARIPSKQAAGLISSKIFSARLLSRACCRIIRDVSSLGWYARCFFIPCRASDETVETIRYWCAAVQSTEDRSCTVERKKTVLCMYSGTPFMLWFSNVFLVKSSAWPLQDNRKSLPITLKMTLRVPTAMLLPSYSTQMT